MCASHILPDIAVKIPFGGSVNIQSVFFSTLAWIRTWLLWGSPYRASTRSAALFSNTSWWGTRGRANVKLCAHDTSLVDEVTNNILKQRNFPAQVQGELYNCLHMRMLHKSHVKLKGTGATFIWRSNFAPSNHAEQWIMFPILIKLASSFKNNTSPLIPGLTFALEFSAESSLFRTIKWISSGLI